MCQYTIIMDSGFTRLPSGAYIRYSKVCKRALFGVRSWAFGLALYIYLLCAESGVRYALLYFTVYSLLPHADVTSPIQLTRVSLVNNNHNNIKQSERKRQPRTVPNQLPSSTGVNRKTGLRAIGGGLAGRSGSPKALPRSTHTPQVRFARLTTLVVTSQLAHATRTRHADV